MKLSLSYLLLFFCGGAPFSIALQPLYTAWFSFYSNHWLIYWFIDDVGFRCGGSSKGRPGSMPPVMRSVPTAPPPPNEICVECNWAYGMKISDHMLALCQKLHIWKYDRQHIFFRTTGTPGLPSSPSLKVEVLEPSLLRRGTTTRKWRWRQLPANRRWSSCKFRRARRTIRRRWTWSDQRARRCRDCPSPTCSNCRPATSSCSRHCTRYITLDNYLQWPKCIQLSRVVGYKWVLTNLYHDSQLYNTTLYHARHPL